MSTMCIRCGKGMPKDRKGPDQVCPECIDARRKKKKKTIEVTSDSVG